MNRLNVTDARWEALFASQLQKSDAPTAQAVVEAIRQTARRFGVHGCAARMAQEFGDHPEAAWSGCGGPDRWSVQCSPGLAGGRRRWASCPRGR